MRHFLNRLVWAWAAICVVAVLTLSWMWWRSGPQVPDHSILHVSLEGPVAETEAAPVAKLFGHDDSLSLVQLTKRISAAASDPRIVGLLLEVKDAHVGLAQLDELERAFATFRKTKKWCVSFLETAGEGGHGDGPYALASLAKEIVLSPPGEIGLNGLSADVPFIRRLLDRAHISAHTQQRYEYKNFANTFNQDHFTPAHKIALASLLDDMQGRLSEIIASGRSASPKMIATWTGIPPMSSGEALKVHAVDRVAYFDEVIEEAKKISGRAEPLLSVTSYLAPKPKHSAAANIALVVAEGEIGRGASNNRPGQATSIGSDDFAEAFRQIRQEDVNAVLIRIDSPGGSYIASDLLRREIAIMRDHNIPVVVSMGNTAASGGYFMATAADHIVAEPGTVTGSIGVVSVSFALRQALDTFLGVTFDSYRTVPNQGGLAGFLDPPDALTREKMSDSVDRIYHDFVDKVAQSRHKTYEEVHAVARGRVWTGRQAVSLGLVDELGGIDTATAYLKRRLELDEAAHINLISYPKPQTPLQMVQQAVGSSVRVGGSFAKVAEILEPVGKHLYNIGTEMTHSGQDLVAPRGPNKL